MKISEDFKGYKRPSEALTVHLIALVPREDLKSAGTIIFVIPAKLLKRVERTSYSFPSTVGVSYLYF
jgi:hypothetical protein